METRTAFLDKAKEELGERDFEGMMPSIDNEYYALVESVVKGGNTISRDVYDSLTDGQRFHFNKQGDKVHD